MAAASSHASATSFTSVFDDAEAPPATHETPVRPELVEGPAHPEPVEGPEQGTEPEFPIVLSLSKEGPVSKGWMWSSRGLRQAQPERGGGAGLGFHFSMLTTTTDF